MEVDVLTSVLSLRNETKVAERLARLCPPSPNRVIRAMFPLDVPILANLRMTGSAKSLKRVIVRPSKLGGEREREEISVRFGLRSLSIEMKDRPTRRISSRYLFLQRNEFFSPSFSPVSKVTQLFMLLLGDEL